MAFVLLNKNVRGAANFAGGLIVGYIAVAFILIFSTLPSDHPYIMWGLVPIVIAAAAVHFDPIANIAKSAVSTAVSNTVPGASSLIAHI